MAGKKLGKVTSPGLARITNYNIGGSEELHSILKSMSLASTRQCQQRLTRRVRLQGTALRCNDKNERKSGPGCEAFDELGLVPASCELYVESTVASACRTRNARYGHGSL